VENPS